MIGNRSEWTADWYGHGPYDYSASQPAEYFEDGFWHLDEAEDGGSFGVHMPASGVRGGNTSRFGAGGMQAGAFNIELNYSPAASDTYIGFRCARGY